MAGRRLVDTSELFQTPIKKVLYSLLVKPGIESALGINKINKLYNTATETLPENSGVFAEEVFKAMNLRYTLNPEDIDRLRAIKGPMVVVANHPFGGLEALFMVLLLSKIRDDFKVMSNFLVERVSEVKNNLILVDSFDPSTPNSKNTAPLKETITFLNSGGLLGVFPSGEVAAYDFKTGKVREQPWNPHIAKIIKKTKATVVPVYFYGRNSTLFQLAGLLHARLRTALLIREFVNPPSSNLLFKIGAAIPPEKIATFTDANQLIEFLRSKTYVLGSAEQTEKAPRLKLINPIRHIIRKEFKPIVPPVSSDILAEEIQKLPAEQKLYTQNAFEVYFFSAKQAPALLMEIGRLRETTFRAVGEGTGKAFDIDQHDHFYTHLAIWQTETHQIVGAYRLGHCDEIIQQRGLKGLYLNSLFDIDPRFYAQVHPALELGRSFVREEYQRNYLSLMLLWIGLGRYVLRYPQYRYFVGPVTISNAFTRLSQSFLVNFLKQYYYLPDYAALIKPKNPFKDDENYNNKFYKPIGVSNLNDLQAVITDIETSDLKIPILLKHYLKLGSKVLDFNIDPDFQNALDGFLLTDITKIEASILRKYMGDEGMAYYLDFQLKQHTKTDLNEFI